MAADIETVRALPRSRLLYGMYAIYNQGDIICQDKSERSVNIFLPAGFCVQNQSVFLQ